MSALEKPLEAAEFTTELVCVRCQQTGFAVWQRNLPSRWRNVTATSPVATSDGFYLRANTQMAENPQILCGRCGTVQRDLVR